jgi:HD-GYP domain-containing protein (c-di-GMP phosphodiesterase class II)
VGALLDELAELLHRGQRDTLDDRADSHGRAVSRLAVTVGKQLGLRPSALAHLRVAALFHELGVVCAPSAVVDKSGHLTDEEFAILRDHPLVGARLLHSLEGLQEASEIVRAQRERYDGQGYPEGLAGSEIPLASRILHACDAFVAMTSARPYRAAVEEGEAIEELRRGAGTQFDPAVVDALLEAIGGAHRLGSPT